MDKLEQAGFFQAALINLLLGNFILGGLLASIFFLFFEAIIVQFICIALVGLYSGWLTISVMAGFEMNSSQKVLAGALCPIPVVCLLFVEQFIFSRLGAQLQMLGAPVQSTAASISNIFGHPSLQVTIIFISVYYLAFNFFAIREIDRAKQFSSLGWYSFGLILLTLIVLLARFLAASVTGAKVS
ncbi:MAG: hypothetical protein V1837_04260 [Candidatus Woesearchaeota archaeon]